MAKHDMTDAEWFKVSPPSSGGAAYGKSAATLWKGAGVSMPNSMLPAGNEGGSVVGGVPPGATSLANKAGHVQAHQKAQLLTGEVS
jgi:hypothetical protein